jgi:hypothetical protein
VITNEWDLPSAEPNTVGCVKYLLHSMFSSLSVPLNGKPVTRHETNYHYKAYLEKLLNYGADASGTHLFSSFWFLDTATDDGSLSADKANKGYTTRLNHFNESIIIELYGNFMPMCLILIECLLMV